MAKIKFRRDTAAAWTESNPTLAQGEPGFEHDTGLFKIGDGETEWTGLDYASGTSGDSLTSDSNIAVTVGNTEYFAIVNRANTDDPYNGVTSSAVEYDSEGNLITLHVNQFYNTVTDNSTQNLIISKFTNTGTLVWQKQIVEDADESQGHDIVIDSSDNIIVMFNQDNAINEDDALVVIKFNSAGTEQWKKLYHPAEQVEINDTFVLDSTTLTSGTFGGNPVKVLSTEGNNAYLGDNTGWSLQVSFDTGTTYSTIETVLGVGTYDSGTDTTPLYLPNNTSISLGSNSYRVQRIGANSFVEASGSATDDTHTYIAARYIKNDSLELTVTWLMKIVNSTGELVWANSIQFLEGADDEAYGMDIDSAGNIIVVGVISGPGNIAYVAKFSGTDGSDIWTKFLSDNNFMEASGGDVTVDSLNNIFVSLNGRGQIVNEDNTSYNVTISHVVKLNSAGAVQWTRRIGPGPCESVGTGIDCDSSGNVYLSALTVAQTNPTRDLSNDDNNTNVLVVVKYSTAGVVLWQRYIEAEGYWYYQDQYNSDVGAYDYSGTNSGRNLSIGPNGKLAIQVAVKQKYKYFGAYDANYWESITFQIDQDGREMTVGSGNEKFTVKASRIPGKMVTTLNVANEFSDSSTYPGPQIRYLTSSVDVTTASITYQDALLAQQIAKSAPYEYVFGNDGTLTIPNDGDIKLVQTQIGWFSIFGPANNNVAHVDIRGNCVDPNTGDVYVIGESDDFYQGFVARYNSQGQILWSIRLGEDGDGYSSRCNAVKINPVTGNIAVLVEMYGSQDNTALIEIDPDTAQVVRQAGIRDNNNNNTCLGYGLDFLSDGTVIVVGSKYDEYRPLSVTAATGSGVGVLVFSKEDILDDSTVEYPATDWYVSGTGITGRVVVDSINRYSNLTTTVRQGSGATFNVIANDGDPEVYTVTIANGGTNYLAGHKIKILGTSLGGTTTANDLILTVATVTDGVITTLAAPSGTADGGAQTTYNAVAGTNYNVGSGFTLTLVPNSSGTVDYAAAINAAGTNYVNGDVLTVAGTQFAGGASPANNVTMTVADASGSGVGGVVSVSSVSGTAPTTYWRIQTTSQTPNYSSGTFNMLQPLGGEAFVVAGTTSELTGNFTIDWSKTVSGGEEDEHDRFLSVAVSGTDIYAVGEMISYKDNVGGATHNGNWVAVVSKFNSAGAHQWTKVLNDTDANCYAKSVSASGNSIVVTHENTTTFQTVITKLDNTGAIKWQRKTVSSDDSAVAIDSNGDIYAVVEANFENQFNDVIKVIKFTANGEIAWRKFFGTFIRSDDGTSEAFKNGRNLTLDADHLYISGYTNAFNTSYRNGFLVKLPKTGDCDGAYGGWVVETEQYDVDKIFATEATAFVSVVATGEFETVDMYFYSQWWDPSDANYYQTLNSIVDRDGGAIEFADGTRQTTSAQMIPQMPITNGADHRLTIDDMGKHIYVTNDNTRIIVPYNIDTTLPVGYVVTVINNSGDIINIDGAGIGSITIVGPDQTDGGYWDLSDKGMATLIKVEPDVWFITGNVTPD